MTAIEDKLMEFIRRDGQRDAPVMFLTIEDGGKHETIADLDKTLDSDGVWEPASREPLNLGKPGTIISKIMVGLLSGTGSLNGWKEYRDEQLYVKNEMNLKFYPVARPNASTWNKELAEYTGLTNNEYVQKCRQRRPEIISQQYQESINEAQLAVILAERDGWREVLSNRWNIAEEKLVKNDKGKMVWTLYFNADGTLAYAYFPIFRQGISNDEIEAFCREVLRYKQVAIPH